MSSAVTIDKHGDEQMVPAVEQEPPAKKVAMPIPSGLREENNSGRGSCLFYAIFQGLLQCAIKAPHNIIRAKVVTLMRKKAKEYEEKWDMEGDCRPRRRSVESLGSTLEELTVDGAWSSALEAAAAPEVVEGLGGLVHERDKNVRAQPEWGQGNDLPEVSREALVSASHGKTCQRR